MVIMLLEKARPGHLTAHLRAGIDEPQGVIKMLAPTKRRGPAAIKPRRPTLKREKIIEKGAKVIRDNTPPIYNDIHYG